MVQRNSNHIRGIPVRIRYDGESYFVNDEIVNSYGVGNPLAQAREDCWLAAQEAYTDVSSNVDRLTPYLQK